MQIDHFVVHVDSPKVPIDSASEIREAGFPFDPKKGKGTKGFRATNIWIGQEYFEITWLLKPDGGGWVPEWVEKYNRGLRGATCVFLRTEELDEISKALSLRNVKYRIERTSFKVLWGLYTVKMPWRVLLLEAIPGTNLEIGFIQYDSGALQRFAKHMNPNSKDAGISGVRSARINVPELKPAKEFLARLFPHLTLTESGFKIPMSNGSLEIVESKDPERLVLFADSQKGVDSARTSFRLEDIRVERIH